MDMPAVTECAVAACAYNHAGACHALAITVGNTRHAHCDTFLADSAHGGDPDVTGRVGACKMSGCVHNVALECQAPGIAVGVQRNVADCLTYSPR
jgi:hypothetical protein